MPKIHEGLTFKIKVEWGTESYIELALPDVGDRLCLSVVSNENHENKKKLKEELLSINSEEFSRQVLITFKKLTNSDWDVWPHWSPCQSE